MTVVCDTQQVVSAESLRIFQSSQSPTQRYEQDCERLALHLIVYDEELVTSKTQGPGACNQDAILRSCGANFSHVVL